MTPVDPPATGHLAVTPPHDRVGTGCDDPPGARVHFLAHLLGIGEHADALRNVLSEESDRLKEAAE